MTATQTLDSLDGAILNHIQDDFPLTQRPFAVLAEKFGIDERTVLERLQAARESGVLRQVSAIFDTTALGYRSSLVAARIAPERLAEGAAIINSHPGVSHNYRRNHDFNVWFTVAVPPEASLEWTVERLGQISGAESVRRLPTLKLYKIGVSLDMTGERPLDARGAPEYSDDRRQEASRIAVTDFDRDLVRALQDDIELTEEPFAAPAARAGLSQERLLDEALRLQRQGHLRRFAAILRHRKAGFTANGMAVWAVPEADTEETGPVMASFRSVSHCYRRPVYPDWPYSIFTMIHARSKAECEATADAIAAATGVSERAMLYSSTEYKKIRLTYFTEELDGWERRERERAATEETVAR
ncbi:MAG: AsnC family transcriptional regulator [Dehalococcoidia bacterium]|nr:AsnC family transcriptional regulator [Dehalococcoidia bacterium]